MDRVGINGCNNDSNEVDLTLKLATPLDLTLRLGLPDLPYNFSQNPRRHNLPQTTNLSLLGPNIQGMNPLGMVTRGATLPPPPGFHGPPRYARSVTLFSGPFVGLTSTNTNRYMLPDLNNNPPTAVPRRRRRTIGPMSHQHELIPPYNFLPILRRRRQRQARNNIDPNKRCTNNSCNTDDTPMWRNGPLGRKTLCNACGIRYKKQEDIRKAIEAAGTGSQTAQPNPN